jgi:FlaA1/EpsC-like NDP-sugar epimerase
MTAAETTSRRPAIERLLLLSRPTKRMLGIAADSVFLPAALWTAISLKLGEWHAPNWPEAWLYVSAVIAGVPVFARLGLYRAVTRFLGSQAAAAVLAGVTISVSLVVLAQAVIKVDLPLTVYPIYWTLALLYVGGSRLAIRYLLVVHFGRVDNVVIYGAGEAGARLARTLIATRQFRPIAFIDDNRALVGAIIHGVQVRPAGDLPDLVQGRRVQRLFLAMPSITIQQRRRVLRSLEGLGIHVQTIPDIAEIVSGKARIDDVREVTAFDLLGRDAVPPNESLLKGCIRDKTVLVTGAGGSIGSELCRQIIRQCPARLLMLEMSELALYNIERELRILAERESLQVEVVALLGNAHHKYRVREILQVFGVQTIYHAAAYKHVPIVEQNVIEGLHNNVFSTWHTAEAALECRVETMVLVSTDKAVNPTNVMGATKRFAEIVLQGLQQRSTYTRFCMVRFGNVLESSGSVVPLFREQIRRGGPVTVTHPDVIRYFMTIPEAAQLVVQAGSMAKGGDVFVLDMGKPIRIADLARRMIHMSGLTVRDENQPDGDIEVRFTGLRPAEKLYEELLIGKSVTGTEHPMIMRAVEHALPWAEVQSLLEEVGVLMRRFDCRAAIDLLARAVEEYRPNGQIRDVVWSRRMPVPVSPELAKVTDLQSRRARQATETARRE